MNYSKVVIIFKVIEFWLSLDTFKCYICPLLAAIKHPLDTLDILV